MEAKGRQKGARSEPNGDQNASKSRCSENEAKSMQTDGAQQCFLGAIRVPFGSQRVPKVDQNASKDRCSEKVAKRVLQGRSARLFPGAFWEPFSIKNAFQNQYKSRCRKSMEIYEKMLQT